MQRQRLNCKNVYNSWNDNCAIPAIILLFVVIIFAVASELEQLFVKQSSLEVYFEWLDSLIERRVAEVRYYHRSYGLY